MIEWANIWYYDKKKGGVLLKRLFLIISLIIAVMLSGCGMVATTKEGTTTQKDTATQAEESREDKVYGLNEKASPVEGFSITVTAFNIQGVKGDRTADNYANANGEYFAKGSDIVKASDYNSIVVDVEFENNTEKAISISTIGWKAILQDGYKLKNFKPDGKYDNQIASNNKIKLTLSDIVEKTISVKQVDISYSYLDYNDEWSQAMKDAMTSKITKDEFLEKFKPIPITWKLNI